MADERDRQTIYCLRHAVYAQELGQHSVTSRGSLSDTLDAWNVYLVARIDGHIAGFISITPPGKPAYSIDKYFSRDALPFAVDEGLFEIRLLTVLKPYRGGDLALALMYAALRLVESHRGTSIVAIGRQEVLEMYLHGGLTSLGLKVRAGAVTYELLHGTTIELRERANELRGLLDRLESKITWSLPFSFKKPASCFHGGAFFEAIGTRFDQLSRSTEIINADVLDAWFEPSPKVLSALKDYLPWLLRTSPPAGCEGLVETIAETRNVRPENILPGSGSSDLIFRAFPHWLNPDSHALILDPTYGEYAHVLEKVIGCTVDRLQLARETDYALNLEKLESALKDEYDMVVIVNPNSPTGRHMDRKALEGLLSRAPGNTRIWLDETYVEYSGAVQSLERFAAQSENVIVCKSMSKVYALSGARVGYLCAGAHQLEDLRAITPPWAVSLIAQVAAVNALQDPAYYAARYRETALLREDLAAGLRFLGLAVTPGIANFILCHLPADGPDAATVVTRCREQNLFLRDASAMGTRLGAHTLRIAVKNGITNFRMLEILRDALAQDHR
jgi:histidinol-phosphate/aromatic aminotransferase/cobyric acid decarboxylase-like protein